jgi:hypothetical protein
MTLYYSVIPLLCAIASGMSWHEFNEERKKYDPKEILMRMMVKAGVNDQLGAKKLAFAVCETLINAYVLCGASLPAIESNPGYILDEAKSIFEHRIKVVLDQLSKIDDETGVDLG